MFKYYIKTFKTNDLYADDYIDVTDYVKSIFQIRSGFDEQEFRIGVNVFPNVMVTVDNSTGKFSDVNTGKILDAPGEP